jgi:hypothetical protein
VSDSSLSRSSFVSVTLYRGTILYHRTELGFRIRHPLRYCLLGACRTYVCVLKSTLQNARYRVFIQI